ncbi:MAG: LuxR C-terminal-related transcriptional regulator, partial [Coriobacteriales bacterium]|nr:LuxR C-terminal-related transcriptional regulator [Coriobacteriales bacterium]
WYSGVTEVGTLGCLIFGAFLTGVGNAGLLVCWGELYTSLYRDDRQRILIAVAIIIYILLWSLLTLVPTPILSVFLILLPVFTICAIHFASQTSRVNEETTQTVETRYSPYFALFCLVYALPLGYFQICFMPGTSSSTTNLATDWLPIALISVLLIAIAMSLDVFLVRRFKLSILPKVIVPVSIGGLLLLALLNTTNIKLAGVLIFSSQQFLNILFYALFALLAVNGRDYPAKTFAIGVAFIDGGFIVGQLIGEVSLNFSDGFGFDLTLGIVYLVALVSVFLFTRISEALGNHQSNHQLRPQVSQNTWSRTTPAYDQYLLAHITQKNRLTAREEEILTYLLRGKSVPAIARESFLSQNTIKTHVSHIYQKLAVHSRDELIDCIENERHLH